MARLAIESRPGLDHTVKVSIRRFNPGTWTLLSHRDETVIGRAKGKTCALICYVRRNDFIGTREVFPSGREVWSYYRIDASFRPVPFVGKTRSPDKADRDSFLFPVNDPVPLPIVCEESDARRFFSQRHPAWLQEIVDRQIAQWRESSPEFFFRFAPSALQERGLEKCVKQAPFAALARFKGLLDAIQMSRCVKRSPRGAVIHALEHVPEHLRANYLLDHCRSALYFSADNLSDPELKFCAKIDCDTGYLIRKLLPPQRQAIALASSYFIHFLREPDSMEEAHREITESIAAFPEQWQDSEPGGLAEVFEKLAKRIGWRFDALLFAEILRKKDHSRGAGPLEQFLADML